MYISWQNFRQIVVAATNFRKTENTRFTNITMF